MATPPSDSTDAPTHVVFSIATNGYEKVFANCIESQREYCRRIGVPYRLVTGRPPWGINAHDSAWMKVAVMHHLIQKVTGGVLYLDADCEVQKDVPDFREWDSREPTKSLFACRDFSERLNAAVIYCRSTPAGRQLVRKLRWSAFVPEPFIPRCDRNLYENGHFIWLLKNSPHVHVMPHEWNSGIYRPCTGPCIIHHGGTIMRESAVGTPMSLASRLNAALVALRLPRHLAYYKQCLDGRGEESPELNERSVLQ